MKMVDARLHHGRDHMDRSLAEELWREACFAFLTAALRGAPQKVMTERAAALWRAREDLMVLEQVEPDMFIEKPKPIKPASEASLFDPVPVASE